MQSKRYNVSESVVPLHRQKDNRAPKRGAITRRQDNILSIKKLEKGKDYDVDNYFTGHCGCSSHRGNVHLQERKDVFEVRKMNERKSVE